MRSAVLWQSCLFLTLLVQAQPPPSLASLQAQLEALKAQLPPTCNGSSFLQRNSTGWFCVTPVRQSGSNSSGWCRASQDGSETITCDVSPSLLGSPPDCRPPGGKWLGFSNATLGGWICVCNAGWSATSCNISTGVQEIACSAPPVCISAGWSGLYRFVDGGMVCDCLPGWGAVDCGHEELGLPPVPPSPLPPPPSPPPPPAPLRVSLVTVITIDTRTQCSPSGCSSAGCSAPLNTDAGGSLTISPELPVGSVTFSFEPTSSWCPSNNDNRQCIGNGWLGQFQYGTVEVYFANGTFAMEIGTPLDVAGSHFTTASWHLGLFSPQVLMFQLQDSACYDNFGTLIIGLTVS